jgi:hypothetical protein
VIRTYRESDLKRINELHRKQGFDYAMPDLGDPVFAISSVANEDGQAQVAAFVKVVGEAYLFVDPEYADPRTRWQTLLQVHEDVRRQAAELGLSEVTCWLPPNLPRAFERRLKRLGWQEEPTNWKRAAYHIRSIALQRNSSR